MLLNCLFGEDTWGLLCMFGHLHARCVNLKSKFCGISDWIELLNTEYVLPSCNEEEWFWFVIFQILVSIYLFNLEILKSNIPKAGRGVCVEINTSILPFTFAGCWECRSLACCKDFSYCMNFILQEFQWQTI